MGTQGLGEPEGSVVIDCGHSTMLLVTINVTLRISIIDDKHIWVRAGNLNKKCITRSVHVLIRSVYVPHTFPLHFERIYYKMIRSYTFRATLPFKCGNVPPEAYVPTRSVQPCREKRKT